MLKSFNFFTKIGWFEDITKLNLLKYLFLDLSFTKNDLQEKSSFKEKMLVITDTPAGLNGV